MKNLEEILRTKTKWSSDERMKLVYGLWNFCTQTPLKPELTLSPRVFQVENGFIALVEDAESYKDYAAPEVLFGHRLEDKESRLFSLGLILYFAFTGHPYWEATGASVLMDMRDILSDRGFLIPAEKQKNLSLEMASILSTLTSANREKRCVGEQELKKMLEGEVTLDYLFQGRVIATEKKKLPIEGVKLSRGKRVTFDKKSYQLTQDVEISYRQGACFYSVDVESVSTDAIKKLFLRTPRKRILIFVMDGENHLVSQKVFELEGSELEFEEYFYESVESKRGRKGNQYFSVEIPEAYELPLNVMLYWEQERGIVHVQVQDGKDKNIVRHQMYLMRE